MVLTVYSTAVTAVLPVRILECIVGSAADFIAILPAVPPGIGETLLESRRPYPATASSAYDTISSDTAVTTVTTTGKVVRKGTALKNRITLIHTIYGAAVSFPCPAAVKADHMCRINTIIARRTIAAGDRVFRENTIPYGRRGINDLHCAAAEVEAGTAVIGNRRWIDRYSRVPLRISDGNTFDYCVGADIKDAGPIIIQNV